MRLNNTPEFYYCISLYHSNVQLMIDPEVIYRIYCWNCYKFITNTVICLVKAHPLIKAPPMVWGPTTLSTVTKIASISLIIDRFSNRNQHLKAQNPSFYSVTSDLTLLSRPAPLLGILRYVYYSIKSGYPLFIVETVTLLWGA